MSEDNGNSLNYFIYIILYFHAIIKSMKFISSPPDFAIGAEREKKLTFTNSCTTVSDHDFPDLLYPAHTGARFKIFFFFSVVNYSSVLFYLSFSIRFKEWYCLVLSNFYWYHFCAVNIFDNQYKSADVWEFLRGSCISGDVFGKFYKEKKRR